MFRTSIGKAALSSFRLDKLRAALAATGSGVTLEDTRHCYFIELSEALGAEEQALLQRLLSLEEQAGAPKVDAGTQSVLIVPRLGTISPWSSKATDIARHCALPQVMRIERGLTYFLKSKRGKALTAAEQQAVLPLLHDRMTESVVFDIAGIEEKIFQHGTPQPLSSVDILAGGAAALEVANRALGLALSPDEIRNLVKEAGIVAEADGRLLLQSTGFDAPKEAGQAIARLQREGLAALAGQLTPAEGTAETDVAAALKALADAAT